MSSWFSSWIPGIPSMSFALPSGIQRRFISFVLKKSLGHLFRPGQLDSNQIDTQIGSGYVQVNDLELNNQAINSLMSALPLELHDGSISSVAARIPWPNPLTSTLGLTLNSLHLVFHLIPARRLSRTPTRMSDSVASVAETFLHEELSPGEEVTLRESFYSDIAQSPINPQEDDYVPGGLDPFLSSTDEETDVDPDGVSLFTSLIERLLARFEFSATDIKLTFVLPGQTSFAVTVDEVRYETTPTDTGDGVGLMSEAPSQSTSTLRRVSIRGVRVSNRSLRPTSPPGNLPRASPDEPITASPASSSSSLDEETHLMMSQSIAVFPPRHVSPSSSVSNSMYESAISTTPLEDKSASIPDIIAHAEARHFISQLPELSEETVEDLILSLGSEPIIFDLITPPANHLSEHPGLSSQPPLQPKASSNVPGIRTSLSIGLIGLSLYPCHVRNILEVAKIWKSQSLPTLGEDAVPFPAPAGTFPPWLQGFGARFHLRGLVAILHPSQDPAGIRRNRDAINQYFTRPLLPPHISPGYVRAHVDCISGSFSLGERESGPGDAFRPAARPLSDLTTLSVDDFSIFAFRNPSDYLVSNNIVASPILVTDTLLPSQYPVSSIPPQSNRGAQWYPQLPDFDILDYTDEANWSHGVKLSTWRAKQKGKEKPYHRRHSSQTAAVGTLTSPPTYASNIPDPDSTHIRRAIQVTLDMPYKLLRSSPRQYLRDEPVINIDIVPIHTFIALGDLLSEGGLITFLDEALASSSSAVGARQTDGGSDSECELDHAARATTPQPRSSRSHEGTTAQEQQELDHPFFADLNLGVNHQTRPQGPARNHDRKHQSQGPRSGSFSFNVHIPFVRLQLRCPSPPSCPQRSGALVLDFHDIGASTPMHEPHRATFEDIAIHRDCAKDALLFATFARVVVSASLPRSHKATGFISLGPLVVPDHSSGTSDERIKEPLKPALSFSKPSSSSASPGRTAVTVDLPSVHVILCKNSLDGLQYWADDVSQLVSSFGDDKDTDSTEDGSGATSMIGSRFFVKSRGGSGMGSGLTVGRTTPQSETIIKLSVSEAQVTVMLRRQEELGFPVRPFEVRALDIDMLMELKPEGKEETVLTLGVMDVSVTDTTVIGSKSPFLRLTSPRSLTSTPKSMVKLRLTSLVIPETTAKETRVSLTLCDFTYNFFPNFAWLEDLAAFAKAPPGAFESVIPSERTQISLKVMNGSVRVHAPVNPGSIVLHFGDLGLSTTIEGNSPESSVKLDITKSAILVVDNVSACASDSELLALPEGVVFWQRAGYALLAELDGLALNFSSCSQVKPPDLRLTVDGIKLRLHLCADTLNAVLTFVSDLILAFKPDAQERPSLTPSRPAVVSEQFSNQLLSSLDEHAFRQVVGLGPMADMISDDLPTNLDYLDDSFSTAAGLRELRDDDLEDFDTAEKSDNVAPSSLLTNVTGVVSRVGGETIKILLPEGVHVTENFFDSLPPIAEDGSSHRGDTTLRVGIHNGDITLLLYDGYDWARTRKIIEEEVKEMRRRLAKIRQLVATGQTPDPSIEETSALLFNSMYIGLENDAADLEPGALIAAIDDELGEDHETSSQSTWEPLGHPSTGKVSSKPTRIHGKRLTRARTSSIEIRLMDLNAEIDKYRDEEPVVSRIFATVKDLEILDHIKTSTWKKFLTDLRSDMRGNVRETGSNMVRLELLNVHPVPGHPSEEARLKAKVLPLRLYVDQDALDFLKKFFSFRDSEASPTTEPDADGIYFQHAEVFPVDIKLDYKPRRVDYRALKAGKTIELMNFFHFDGAEMTLRHITLSGITGWPRFFDLLNDLWTPDVKATQLVDVISGVAPIRSMVNVGSGFADLVLLPIAQYKKDGRIVRGVQKGTTSFVKSTAMEAVKMGARLATGTQVILEQAEGVLGGQFTHPITTETLQVPFNDEDFPTRSTYSDDETDTISKYAEQPTDIKDGVQSAYRSMRKNLNSAAQTILAVPMEVYERSGSEGPVRAVIRAVPIAVLKPMIGASEAVSKTLMGLHNTLDPGVRQENHEKYKQR